MLKNVAVVIPCYKDHLTTNEWIAVDRCKAVLNKYRVKIVKPHGLSLPAGMLNFNDYEVIGFDEKYFENIAGYNKLMLSAEFYGRFLDFEYILIYQLDAFVFADELLAWCAKGYDYIGAPWTSKNIRTNALKIALLNFQRHISYYFNLKKRNVPNKYQFENRVGNGGFSLRKVKPFHNICTDMKVMIDHYLIQNAHQYNEDAFWGLEVNRKKKVLSIPEWNEALNFCFETHPYNALKLTDGQLPFGCHDWDNYPDFWRPIFKKFGYEI